MTKNINKYSEVWKSPIDYFNFARHHGVWGEAAIKLKKELDKKKSIGQPKIKNGLDDWLDPI